MSRNILSGVLLFVCLMLAWAPAVYSDHCGETTTTTTTNDLPEQATVPNTQSTTNMDSVTTARPNDTFMISPGDLDVSSRLTLEAERRLYEWASKEVEAKERLRKEKLAEEKFQKWLSEPSSSEYEAERKESAKQFHEEEKKRKEEWKEFNRKMSDELGSAWDPKTGRVIPSPLPKVHPVEPKPIIPATPPPPPKDDNWDFLPDFIPGVSVYENMPEAPVTPEAVPTPPKGPVPAGEKSGGSGGAKGDDFGTDLITH